jgi:CelD/BcsL family acetyltransferase involved in cellulose biosynthesis
MSKITIVDSLPEEQWNSFVQHHPMGNIFHTPEMFEVYSRTQGHQPELWAATEDGRILALLVPVRITLIYGVLRYLTTRAVTYGSVLCAAGGEGQQGLSLLLQTYTQEVRRTTMFTELRNLSDLAAVQPILRERGFRYEDHLNYFIDLKRPLEAIFHSIGARTRKNIRHGLNRGQVAVEEVKEQGHVASCYDLLRQTYGAAQVPLADRSLFEAAFELLYPKGMVRFTLARVCDAPAAVSVELLYKDVVYGWYGGMDRSYGCYVPNELLMWHILKWSAEKGYRLYDFGGAGRPDEEYGVRDFKTKFGGTLVNHGLHIFVHTPWLLKISEEAYRLARRVLLACKTTAYGSENREKVIP